MYRDPHKPAKLALCKDQPLIQTHRCASPFMSILSHLNYRQAFPSSTRLMYSCRVPKQDMNEILFLDRLNSIFCRPNQDLRLYLTGDRHPESDLTPQSPEYPGVHLFRRRFLPDDLINGLPSPERRHATIVYVCGPPQMTDEVVEFLTGLEGMSEERVLCEKWW